MKMIGIPYTEQQVASAGDAARAQGEQIAEDLKVSTQGAIIAAPDSEIVALTAYLQSLGKKLPPPDDTKETEAGAAPVASASQEGR
jgi:cbb3-type cytochrome oxidase cytochrome c subunit